MHCRFISRVSAVYNILIVSLDSELKTMAGIINQESNSDAGKSEVGTTHDQLFIDRLKNNPRALKMSFWEHHFEWRSLKHYPEISGRVLDFGCGTGHSDIFLARQGMTVHGIDLSSVGIAIALYLKGIESEDIRRRLSFEVVDVTKNLPERGLFDAAWSAHVFEHIEHPGAILQGLRCWLKPNAVLLISVPLGYAYDDPDHVNHFFSEGDLENYLGEYVTVERVDIFPENQVLRALCRFS